ncbi:hypothetical protein QTG56_25190 (plasmid) [Rossellomorea sp. AcN35-11]|nr:hypothetical protein [Rossellomorea aquimaris]WJV31930.1 hypothetical protein QTG56_25190 [Rossellomorea sp. AcN35-11]
MLAFKHRKEKFSEKVREEKYNPLNNPHNLKEGDYVLLRHVEGVNVPKKMSNKWYEIKEISLTGIPKVHQNVFRYLRPDNIQLIVRN